MCQPRARSDAEYFASKALSKSAIDLLLECPAYYKAWFEDVDDRIETKPMAFGGMFHKLCLEPEQFASEFAVTDLNLAYKAGKDWKAALAPGVSIVKSDDYESALMMAEAVREGRRQQHDQ